LCEEICSRGGLGAITLESYHREITKNLELKFSQRMKDKVNFPMQLVLHHLELGGGSDSQFFNRVSVALRRGSIGGFDVISDLGH